MILNISWRDGISAFDLKTLWEDSLVKEMWLQSLIEDLSDHLATTIEISDSRKPRKIEPKKCCIFDEKSNIFEVVIFFESNIFSECSIWCPPIRMNVHSKKNQKLHGFLLRCMTLLWYTLHLWVTIPNGNTRLNLHKHMFNIQCLYEWKKLRSHISEVHWTSHSCFWAQNA